MDALNGTGLPVLLTAGRIGKITLNIPFRHLTSQPTVVEVEDVWMVLKPNAEFEYDDAKEAELAFQAKLTELKTREAALALAEEQAKARSSS